jgi:hypothetical protein
MAVLGHKTLSEAERYTRDADQLLLASAAVGRLEGRNANSTAQTNPDSLGKKQKIKGNQCEQIRTGAP